MSEVTNIAIRPMRPEDAARVAELTTELGYPSTEDEIRRRYGLIINRSDASLFVAHDARNRTRADGRQLGFLEQFLVVLRQ